MMHKYIITIVFLCMIGVAAYAPSSVYASTLVTVSWHDAIMNTSPLMPGDTERIVWDITNVTTQPLALTITITDLSGSMTLAELAQWHMDQDGARVFDGSARAAADVTHTLHTLAPGATTQMTLTVALPQHATRAIALHSYTYTMVLSAAEEDVSVSREHHRNHTHHRAKKTVEHSQQDIALMTHAVTAASDHEAAQAPFDIARATVAGAVRGAIEENPACAENIPWWLWVCGLCLSVVSWLWRIQTHAHWRARCATVGILILLLCVWWFLDLCHPLWVPLTIVFIAYGGIVGVSLMARNKEFAYTKGDNH